MYWFATASLTPAVLLIAACLFGGPWPLIALVYITGFVMLVDHVRPRQIPLREDDAAEQFARRLSVLLALVHFVVLPLGVWAMAVAPWLDTAQALAIGIALGMFMGQVSNSNAHEMIHAPSRGLRLMGVAVYISLLFGHHASAHPKVHHVHVATDRDPNSARGGVGFYRFWPRAWIGSFIAGLRAENAARARRTPPPAALSHPYVAYCTGAALALLLAFGLAGWIGVAVFVGVTGYAQMQLILADYVQHYGLRRVERADGRREPAGAQHSWNAAPWYSAAMMLNAPHHSDHHMHPMRLFPALRLDETMPILPFSLPAMAAIALVPSWWRRLMDPRVTAWVNLQATGGVAGGDLALSGHATELDDSSGPDGPGDLDGGTGVDPIKDVGRGI